MRCRHKNSSSNSTFQRPRGRCCPDQDGTGLGRWTISDHLVYRTTSPIYHPLQDAFGQECYILWEHECPEAQNLTLM